jgi:hypothetical protein
MFLDGADLLFAALTLLCVLISLLPYNKLMQEGAVLGGMSAGLGDTESPSTCGANERRDGNETAVNNQAIIISHRGEQCLSQNIYGRRSHLTIEGNRLESDYYHYLCDSALEMLPAESRIQKQSNSRSHAPKVVQHKASGNHYWKCLDCAFRLEERPGFHTADARVGDTPYLIQYTDRFLVKSHIRQRQETHPKHGGHPRYGCHFCILESRGDSQVKGDYTKIVTLWQGRDALLQHIADRHLKEFPSPKIMQVLEKTVDSSGRYPDIEFWKR